MATPVEYTQQYIPTPSDIGMMQGQLNTMQSEYDAGYAAPLMFEQEFSQLPVTGDNIAGKQAVLGNFQNKVKGIADKYGGDYGAASKDIVREITRERQKPFYQLAPKHAAMAEEARKVKQALGPNALIKKDVPSNFVDEKGNVTNTDFSYDIADVRDFEKPMAQMFKEFATGFNKDINYSVGNGYRRMGTQFGAKDVNEAMQGLQSSQGQAMLQQIYGMYDMQPGENVTLDNFIQTIAMGNIVGTQKTQLVQDLDEASARRSASKQAAISSGPKFVPNRRTSTVISGGGRQKKSGVGVYTLGGSSLNKDMNQKVDNYTTRGTTWVTGTPEYAGDIEGDLGKKGRSSDMPVTMKKATVTGYDKILSIIGVEGVGSKAVKNVQSSEEGERLEKDYNIGSIVTFDTKGTRDSSLGINQGDKNTVYNLDGDRPHIVVNSGTDEQMIYYVSPQNVKVMTDDKGRTVYEKIDRTEAISAFGKDHGDPLVRTDKSGRASILDYEKPLVKEHVSSIVQKIASSGDQKSYANILNAWALIEGGYAVNDLVEKGEITPELAASYEFLINSIDAEEVKSHDPMTKQAKFTPEAY